MTDWRVVTGDCLEVVRGLDANSVDAVVTDPPYGLLFMGKDWDHGIPGEAFWVEALRVAKPGAHLVAFGGTRTFHRLACAIEDAGWEIRDTIATLDGSPSVLLWLHGQGFPKSKNLGNGIGSALKPAFEPIILARKPLSGTLESTVAAWGTGGLNIDGCRIGTGGGYTNHTRKAEGTGAGWHPVSTGERTENGGRWPANCVLSHHEDCREVGTRRVRAGTSGTNGRHGFGTALVGGEHKPGTQPDPTTYADADGMETVLAWDCHPSCPVRLLDEQSGERPGMKRAELNRGATTGKGLGYGSTSPQQAGVGGYGDTGGTSRFYYTAKASRREREAGLEGMPRHDSGAPMNSRCAQCSRLRLDHESSRCRCEQHVPAEQVSRGGAANHHPTVKPLSLMRWLCRLVTPPGGLVLDPFSGSGSTGCAAVLEGFRFLGIEQAAEYVAIAERRIAHWAAQVPRNGEQSPDLFAEVA